MKKAALILADGAIFEGTSFSCETSYTTGEVVFNTAQTGYQEILTDPSYAQQIIVFTQPHIGNVGVNKFDMESNKVHAKALAVCNFSLIASNWRAEETLQRFLSKQHIPMITDVDTRALTQHLREFGNQAGCLMNGDGDIKQALNYARHHKSMLNKDLTLSVSTDKMFMLNRNRNKKSKKTKQQAYHVVVYDYGVKHSILKLLVDTGCVVTVVPATTNAQDVLALAPDGIVLSNGPGDPALCTYALEIIKQLLAHSIPIMGICLGHQLLALASGATTKKMSVGHHGANHPIQSLKTNAVAITSQNHGFVVSDERLPACVRVTHRSLFDGTIAGIERIDIPAFGFQGHPEASPGPTELTILFDQFVMMMEKFYAKAS